MTAIAGSITIPYQKHRSLTNYENIPLLMIPSAEPLIRDANDWEARFETVRSTFSSRVGQICNAALDRSIIAYNENSDDEERRRCREETEVLAILTGLDRDILNRVAALLKDYESCLSRIRACRAEIKQKRRRSDVERILFSRGQEDSWDTDELYAQLSALPPERVSEILEALRQEKWQFLGEEAREQFLLAWLPEFQPLFDLFSDFRCGGCRVLGNLLCDINEEHEAQARKQLSRPEDSPAFADMMGAYLQKSGSQGWREAVSARCRKQLDQIVKPAIAVRYVAALGKRNLLWDLLLDALEPNILEVRHAE